MDCTVEDIEDETGLDKKLVSQAVNFLTTRGYIENGIKAKSGKTSLIYVPSQRLSIEEGPESEFSDS